MKTNEEYAEEIKSQIVSHIEYLLEVLIDKDGVYDEDEFECYSTLANENPPTYCVRLYNDNKEDSDGIIECQLYTLIFKDNLPIDKKAIAELINLKDYTNEILVLLSDTDYKLTYIDNNKLEFQLSADSF